MKMIIALMLLPHYVSAGAFPIGEVTQAKGTITYLSYTPPSLVQAIKLKQKAMTEGSFLTREGSTMVIKLFDGSHVRLNPRSKIALEYDPATGVITANLFAGSLKVHFTHPKPDQRAQKFIVKSADTVFETVESKFSVVRSLMTDTNSVYVEKGSVVVAQFAGLEKKDSEIVHAQEMTSVTDKKHDIESPHKMTERQLQFLSPAYYLK